MSGGGAKECIECQVIRPAHKFEKGRNQCNPCRYQARYRRRVAQRNRPTCVACGEAFDPPAQDGRAGRRITVCIPCRIDPLRVTRCRMCGANKPRSEYGRWGQAVDRCNTCHEPIHRRMKHAVDLRRRYGRTRAWYDRQFAQQGGRCALPDCLNHLLPQARLPDVDHHHVSGQVREILCNKHNVGGGHYNEDPRLLRQAADYYERWQARGAAGACWARGAIKRAKRSEVTP